MNVHRWRMEKIESQKLFVVLTISMYSKTRISWNNRKSLQTIYDETSLITTQGQQKWMSFSPSPQAQSYVLYTDTDNLFLRVNLWQYLLSFLERRPCSCVTPHRSDSNKNVWGWWWDIPERFPASTTRFILTWKRYDSWCNGCQGIRNKNLLPSRCCPLIAARRRIKLLRHRDHFRQKNFMGKY